MALADFASSPTNEAEFERWSFAHMAHHRDIIRRVQETLTIRLNELVLDPFNPRAMDDWLWRHQQMHTEMDQALGIGGYALNRLNWEDEEARAAWIDQNQDEHYRAGQILGLG